MSFLKWDETFSVGVATVDAQHKGLVESVAALYDSLVPGMSYETFQKRFDELIAATAVHFQHEENFFERTQFPFAEEHKLQHDDLKQQIAMFRDDILDTCDPVKARGMMDYLRFWLVTHIKDEDSKLGAHLNGLGIR